MTEILTHSRHSRQQLPSFSHLAPQLDMLCARFSTRSFNAPSHSVKPSLAKPASRLGVEVAYLRQPFQLFQFVP